MCINLERMQISPNHYTGKRSLLSTHPFTVKIIQMVYNYAFPCVCIVYEWLIEWLDGCMDDWTQWLVAGWTDRRMQVRIIYMDWFMNDRIYNYLWKNEWLLDEWSAKWNNGSVNEGCLLYASLNEWIYITSEWTDWWWHDTRLVGWEDSRVDGWGLDCRIDGWVDRWLDGCVMEFELTDCDKLLELRKGSQFWNFREEVGRNREREWVTDWKFQATKIYQPPRKTLIDR